MITENYLKDKYFDESTWSFYFNDDGEVHEISEEVDKIYYQLKQIQWNDALTVLQGEPYNSLVSKVKLLTDKRAIIYYKDETEIKQIIYTILNPYKSILPDVPDEHEETKIFQKLASTKYRVVHGQTNTLISSYIRMKFTNACGRLFPIPVGFAISAAINVLEDSLLELELDAEPNEFITEILNDVNRHFGNVMSRVNQIYDEERRYKNYIRDGGGKLRKSYTLIDLIQLAIYSFRRLVHV